MNLNGKEVFKMTHMAGVCCEGWLMRSSCCLLLEIISQRWWVWMPVSPVRVQQRGCRSSPTSSAQSDWCWLPRRCSPSHSPIFPSVDSDPLGCGENKFVDLWSRTADQWQGGGRSWGRERKGLRKGKEGFYVTEWKIPRRDRHMPLLFLSSYTPSLLLLSISCSLPLFFLLQI